MHSVSQSVIFVFFLSNCCHENLNVFFFVIVVFLHCCLICFCDVFNNLNVLKLLITDSSANPIHELHTGMLHT